MNIKILVSIVAALIFWIVFNFFLCMCFGYKFGTQDFGAVMVIALFVECMFTAPAFVFVLGEE